MQEGDGGEGEVGPYHVNLTVGEVDELDDTVDHSVAHGDERVDAS